MAIRSFRQAWQRHHYLLNFTQRFTVPSGIRRFSLMELWKNFMEGMLPSNGWINLLGRSTVESGNHVAVVTTYKVQYTDGFSIIIRIQNADKSWRCTHDGKVGNLQEKSEHLGKGVWPMLVEFVLNGMLFWKVKAIISSWERSNMLIWSECIVFRRIWHSLSQVNGSSFRQVLIYSDFNKVGKDWMISNIPFHFQCNIVDEVFETVVTFT